MRFVFFGTDAFSYTAMSSYRAIIDSDLVQPAENTEIYYELKPDLDTLFLGKKFITNSRGLADDEYSLVKPEDVYRVVVAGSSWTMATSVEIDDTYHSILERQLSEQLSPRKAEFINFGVENYGLSEIVANVRYKALDYDPDMVMVAMTGLTPAFKWEEGKAPFETANRVPPFWQSYLYSSAMDLLDRRAYRRTKRPRVSGSRGDYMRQVNRAMDELLEMTADKNIEVVVLVLTHKGYKPEAVDAIGRYIEERKFRFIHAHVEDIAKEYGKENEPLLPDNYVNHPNETGHWLIAQKVFSELWGSPAKD
ncbi:MAG: SGNH/GDSL hydrolase family protein [Gammaproteobacteria bacterium]